MEWKSFGNSRPKDREKIIISTKNGRIHLGYFDFDNYEFPFGFHIIDGRGGYESFEDDLLMYWTPITASPAHKHLFQIWQSERCVECGHHKTELIKD